MPSPIWITKAGSLGIIPDEEFYQFILNVYDSSQTPLPVSGTVTFTNIQTDPEDRNEMRRVIGSGTSFLTELDPGDRLISDYDVVLGIVGEIISDTELLLFQDATFSASGVHVRSADNITFQLISGNLPVGLHIDQFGNMSGVPINGEIEGVPAPVSVVTTSEFTIRATNRAGSIADRTFSLTVAGVNPITISPKNMSLGSFFDGDLFSYQLIATNYKPTSTVTWTVDTVNLPPGVSLSDTGLLRGYINPDSVQAHELSVDYAFKVSVTDGYTIDTSNYTITVFNRALYTADSDILHADLTELETSITEKYTPLLYNFNTTLDVAKQGNYYAYQFIGDDFNGDEIAYTVSENSEDALPSGLTLNVVTGWLYGTIPFGPLPVTEYSLTIRVSKAAAELSNYYVERSFTLPIVSQISNSTIWLTETDLGVIDNGGISDFTIQAYTPSNRPLQYQITAGQLPPGLSLTVDGLIIGRVGFEAFFLDTGDTTFDDGTTFDQVYRFTVEAYSSDLLVVDSKEFYVQVNAVNTKPYENLFIRALPTREQRLVYNQIINNTDIFPPADIYRASDPWFGKNQTLRSMFIGGLEPAEVLAYVAGMSQNHYNKTLNYSEVKTARALDNNFNVKYEVVYLELVDQGINSQGQSAPMVVSLPENSASITSVYPNSFINMRDRIVDYIGYANKSTLPGWMTSRQIDGRVLGFTRALVLCYAKPGKSSEIAYRLSQRLDDLRLVDFSIDRYEWDHYLSSNYDKDTATFDPNVATEFSDNVDSGMTYLKFPDLVISTNLTAGE